MHIITICMTLLVHVCMYVMHYNLCYIAATSEFMIQCTHCNIELFVLLESLSKQMYKVVVYHGQ